MAEKKSAAKKATPAKPNPNAYRAADGIDGIEKGMTDSQMMAALATRSSLSATTLKAYAGGGDALDVTDLLCEMRRAGDEVIKGDLGRLERAMVNQVMTLDAIFNSLAQRSSRQEYMKQMETYLRLALKAQTQARATVEAIALLKNPQPYIRQANIAHGHQQINNTYASASAHTCAEDFPSEPNKLLEANHGQRLDIGAQGAAGRAHQELEPVGAVNRA